MSSMLKKLTDLRESAQESLNSLLQIKNLIQPNILKDKEVNDFLEKEKSIEFKKSTESEIEYFVCVIDSIDKQIEKQEKLIESDPLSTKKTT